MISNKMRLEEVILNVQEEIEHSDENIRLFQSHRQKIAQAIKSYILSELLEEKELDFPDSSDPRDDWSNGFNQAIQTMRKKIEEM